MSQGDRTGGMGAGTGGGGGGGIHKETEQEEGGGDGGIHKETQNMDTNATRRQNRSGGKDSLGDS